MCRIKYKKDREKMLADPVANKHLIDYWKERMSIDNKARKERRHWLKIHDREKYDKEMAICNRHTLRKNLMARLLKQEKRET